MPKKDNKQADESRGAADEAQNPAAPAADESSPDRRKFLTRSGALLALLGAAGVLNVDALAQDNARIAPGQVRMKQLNAREIKSLQDVMQRAIAAKDPAVLQRSTGLPSNVSAILSRLTREDLEAAAQLQSKLGDLKNQLRDNNGVIGM